MRLRRVSIHTAAPLPRAIPSSKEFSISRPSWAARPIDSSRAGNEVGRSADFQCGALAMRYYDTMLHWTDCSIAARLEAIVRRPGVSPATVRRTPPQGTGAVIDNFLSEGDIL
jgi:hypothetical protein